MKLSEQERQNIIENIGCEIVLLSIHTHLCDPAAEHIVSKYDLHGTIDDAINKLKEIQQLFIDNKYTTKMLDDIIKRADRYNQSVANDPYVKEINDAWKLGDNRKISIIHQRQHLRQIEMHNKKECICYY